MARRIINIGLQGNDGTGDSVRDAFKKTNENFQDLYAVVGSEGTIKFTNLDDAPTSYVAGQIFYTDKTLPSSPAPTIQAKTLLAGDGVSITVNSDSIVIGSSAGLNSSAPRLTAGLNANQFIIANTPQPDDGQIDIKLAAWNAAHSDTAGFQIASSDLLINKRYADARYQLQSGTGPLTTRAIPTNADAFVKTITHLSGFTVSIPSHLFSADGSDNGKAYKFSTTGTLPISTPQVVNGGTYYVRYVDQNTISLHTTSSGAQGNINKISFTSEGTVPASLTHADYDATLQGYWLATETLPRREITRRSGDTMTGFLTLSGAPTSPLHAATKDYVDTKVASKDNTDEISEGTTNLYFTNARSRAAISVSSNGTAGTLTYDNITGVLTFTGPSATTIRSNFSVVSDNVNGSLSYNAATGVFTYVSPTASQIRSQLSAVSNGAGSFTYDNTTGVFTYTGPSSNDVTSHFSVIDAGGDGSISYNPVTGVFTYTGPSAADVRAHFSAGTGVTVTNGVIAIGQDVSTSASPTFNKVTANLTGTVLTADQPNITSLGTLSTLHVTGNVVLSGTVSLSQTLAANIQGNVTGTVSSLSNHSTDTLPEGSKKYFSNSLVWSTISATSTGTLGTLSFDSASGVISYTAPTTANLAAVFSSAGSITIQNTTDTISVDVDPNIVMLWDEYRAQQTAIMSDTIVEGSANLFFTSSRARSAISTLPLTGIAYNLSTGVISLESIPNTSLVNNSVTINGQAVSLGSSATLNTDNISESATPTNKWFTVDRARSAFIAGTDISIGAGTISVNSSVTSTANSLVKRSANQSISGVHVSPATMSFILTANRTLTSAEIISNIIRVDQTAARTLTLPSAISSDGYWIVIRNVSAFDLIINSVAGPTVVTIAAGQTKKVMCDGVDWFVL